MLPVTETLCARETGKRVLSQGSDHAGDSSDESPSVRSTEYVCYVRYEYKYGYATVVLVNAVSDAQSEVQELIINNRSINQSALIQSYSVRSYRG